MLGFSLGLNVHAGVDFFGLPNPWGVLRAQDIRVGIIDAYYRRQVRMNQDMINALSFVEAKGLDAWLIDHVGGWDRHDPDYKADFVGHKEQKLALKKELRDFAPVRKMLRKQVAARMTNLPEVIDWKTAFDEKALLHEKLKTETNPEQYNLLAEQLLDHLEVLRYLNWIDRKDALREAIKIYNSPLYRWGYLASVDSKPWCGELFWDQDALTEWQRIWDESGF